MCLMGNIDPMDRTLKRRCFGGRDDQSRVKPFLQKEQFPLVTLSWELVLLIQRHEVDDASVKACEFSVSQPKIWALELVFKPSAVSPVCDQEPAPCQLRVKAPDAKKA